MSNSYTIPLQAGCFYHIYNKGNNGDKVFYNQGNYAYFLRKYDEYMSPCLETFSFCLMPNHFHLLVRVKEQDEFMPQTTDQAVFERLKAKAGQENKDLSGLMVSEQFRRFFMTYSKAVNKQQGREGSLFRKYFKRKKIDNLQYLQQVVRYIHRNPEHHGFDVDFTNYPWSSYSRMFEARITQLKKEDVIGWFGGKENYAFVHRQNADLNEELLLDD